MGKIGMIAENMEKYISLNIDVIIDWYEDELGRIKEKKIQLRFIDSMKFMTSNLDSLMNNLVKDGWKLISFQDYSKAQYKLLIRKRAYLYEYITNWDRFEETQLPPMEAFDSKLNMSGITDKDYERAQKVWDAFSIKNVGEYHDLYLKTDVILLANMFEAFRDTCLEHYKFDPAHFYTSPGLALKACLKKVEVKLELLTKPYMLLMFEHRIRGGITQVVHWYMKVNNKYMGDSKGESSFLQYLDANNLYSWAMRQLLPTGGFTWVSKKIPMK